MDEPNDIPKDAATNNDTNCEASTTLKKQKVRTNKRRRLSSSDEEPVVPVNMSEPEKSIQSSAAKNNSNETTAKKIAKKAVPSTHMLALVKKERDDGGLPSQFTRSKVKELLKVSPQTRPWTPQLTPIKHIPVKTRPEVKALIAQDLPEDEDDDEYKPMNDEVASDDDQTLESCSDVESLPRTPATPKDPTTSSPEVVKDGPFKVPQNVSATKRKLNMEEEEATIARRTRSKLSLSSTSIEHIESTFVPPDDIPMPAVDDLWNEFLNECLNPASTSKNEDDEEADPEYNVATDADAVDDDEENLSKSIIRISKKELNDLVTELCAIMPEGENEISENLFNSVLTDTGQNEIRWEGKQEPQSDEEQNNVAASNGSQPASNATRFSIGKTEPEDLEQEAGNDPVDKCNEVPNSDGNVINNDEYLVKSDENDCDGEEIVIIEIKEEVDDNLINIGSTCVTMVATEEVPAANVSTNESAPLPVKKLMETTQHKPDMLVVRLDVDPGLTVRPEQVQIFQQQLRQHIQIATFNFLQLYVHPIHWKFAPHFKEYVQSLVNIYESNPKSVVNVCNLKPAHELIASWETTVSQDNDENKAMVKFIQEQSKRCQHRTMNNSIVTGEFPEQLKRVVCASGVFLYPHLLPHVPFRPDHVKRFTYSNSEDELIAIGLEQFWQYVDDNRKLLRVRAARRGARARGGLTAAVEQLARHMLPFMHPRHILLHVNHVRKHGHTENPIKKFFKNYKVEPVKHKLLPFNPQMTIYEHPASEIPRPWLKYLSQTSNRFKKQFTRSVDLVQPTTGVPVEMGQDVEAPTKNPLPIEFKETLTTLPKINFVNNCDVNPNPNVMVATNLYNVVPTGTGFTLVPLMVQDTNVVTSQIGPITTPAEVKSNVPNNLNTQNKDVFEVKVLEKPLEGTKIVPKSNLSDDHCECCVLLRKICKEVKLITDYFKPSKYVRKVCQCRDRTFPKVSNRLKLFLDIFKSHSAVMLRELEEKLKSDEQETHKNDDEDDFEYAVLYQIRFLSRMNGKFAKFPRKKRLYSLFSGFNISTGNPVDLANEVYKCTKDDALVLYDEFLGFLTPEQAQNVGVFNHYIVSHMKTLMNRIEQDITDIERRKAVLTKLKQVFDNSKDINSCQMCKSVLLELKGYPQLAGYVFSLFPHKICTQQGITLRRLDVEETTSTNSSPPPTGPEVLPRMEKENTEPVSNIIETRYIDKSEPNITEKVQTLEEKIPSPELRTSKSDASDDSRGTPENCMVIVEDEIKSERQDWTREEDKILLEIIQQYLASEESKNKSIYNILQDNEVYQLISERMIEKSMDDIVQRVMYLIEVLVVNHS